MGPVVMVTRLAVALTVLTAVGLAVVAGVTVAVVCRCLARDEEQHDDCGVCPGCDPGPDDDEARLVVFAAPMLAGVIDQLIDRIAEGETCPDYPHEIVWSES